MKTLIERLDGVRAIWEGLKASLDDSSTQSVRSVILHKFSTLGSGGDESVAEYLSA